jgi:energy-coupling factor transporter ATP-binding protein EcfA2
MNDDIPDLFDEETFQEIPIEPDSEPTPPPKPKPLASQAIACDRLWKFAEAFFNLDWQSLPIKPRLRPLLVGPTGSGKTWLVKHVASLIHKPGPLPVLRVTLGDWILVASRASKGHTLAEIQRFVTSHDYGIIHIDELDKFTGHSDWTQYVIQEMFSVCDGVPVQAHSSTWTELQQQRLKNQFLIIGSGTWQSLWDKPKQLGFLKWEDQKQFVDRVRTQRVIAPEIFRRFNEDLICLSYPTREEVLQIIDQLRTMVAGELLWGLEQYVDEIVDSQKGIRWFEEYFARRMMNSLPPKQKNI